MGGLKIWLVLCLGYLVTTQHHNEANKKKTFATNFEKLGKFRKAAIGTTLKNKSKEWSGKKERHPPAVNLVKEFTEFKKSNVLRKPEALKEQNKRSKDDSLEKIDQLENLIVTKGESRGQSTTTKTIERDTLTSTSTESKVVEDGNSNQTTQTTDESGPETPKTLSLTSDSNQKRGTLEELNQDDGTFVVAVVGVALCCIIAVVGVGFILHRPVSCPGSSSPLSDNSPTFHSAKLAFSSRSPDDKTSNSKQLSRTDTRNLKRKSAEEPEKSSSRAFKFRENTDNNNQGHMYNYKGNLRQESLIDIDGPEEDEDFIYECPGLAPHGEMEVTNPFFLQKDFNMNMDHLAGAEEKGGAEVVPCPINNDNTIRHGNIVRNIKPGQQ